jgi:hypothetical protein
MNKKYYTKSQKYKIGDPIVSKNDIFIVTCTGYSDGKHWYEKTKLNDYIENKANAKIKLNERECERRVRSMMLEVSLLKKKVGRLSDSKIAKRMFEAESKHAKLNGVVNEIYERLESELGYEEEY